MPRRTNTFQDVVAIVQRHMAGEAVVTESAMVTPLGGGDAREVDVLITAEVAGHAVSVGVEACRTGRPATVEWVERMIGKHQVLPINKLVLYSASGFTANALNRAEQHGIAAISEAAIPDERLATSVLNGLRTIWPKVVSLTPQRARVWVSKPDGREVWFRAPRDLALFFEDGQSCPDDLQAAVVAKLQAQMRQVTEQIGLANISESMERTYLLMWTPFSCRVNGEERRLWVRNEEGSQPHLERIEKVVLEGAASIEVQRVDLAHARLGEVRIAYGEMVLGGQAGLIVASDSTEGEMLTIRLRPRD